jgi:hypothetical protein
LSKTANQVVKLFITKLEVYLLAVLAARLKAAAVGLPLAPGFLGLPPRFRFWFIL